MAGLCALLAVSAKETGALAAPLLAVLAFAEGEGALGPRVREALRAAAPALLLLALFLALRMLVLGGLGGHADTSILSGVWRAPGLALLFVPALLVPQPAGALTGLAALALALLFPLALVLCARESARVRRALLVPSSWAVALLVLSGVSGDLAPWYAPTLLPAYSLVFGALIAALRSGWQSLPKASRTAGVAVALLLALSPLRYSGLFERYEQWHTLSAESAAFLADLQSRIEALPPGGGVVRITGLPERRARVGPVGVHGAAGLGRYSVTAWAALELPGRRIVVREAEPEARSAGEVVVLIGPARLP